MPNGEITIEEQRLMQLQQARMAEEMAAEEADEAQKTAKPAETHFINSGEATIMLAFTGIIEAIQAVVDWLNLAFFIGEIINIIITIFVGFVLFIWLTGKIAKGAPKKWYKAIYWGAVGGAVPIVPAF